MNGHAWPEHNVKSGPSGLDNGVHFNMSIKDLSILYGLTPNTVKTKLRRGKLRLCWTLDGMGLGYKVIEGIEPFDARYARLLDPDLKRILFASACKSSDFETHRAFET